EEVHTVVNELERPIGTYLYGRRKYEVMRYWETADTEGQPAFTREYARIWQAADKIVYSTTLDTVTTARTTIERSFDADAIRTMKESGERDISVGGPTLAAVAFRAGLVDECHLILAPVLVGGGTRTLPDGVRARLELLGEHGFTNGMVHLHYRVRPSRTVD
ncbi:MAG: dihydrofolate reductase family protein, partial [Actinomycetota bacterium]|nr:dihydrofolate reductase family protein [Actinomycetota bacterium]